MTKKNEDKQQVWKKHISAWKYSGESQQVYCSKHNIKPNQLWYWNRKLYPDEVSPKNVRSPSCTKSSAFIPVQVACDDLSDQSLSVKLPNGVVINGITPQAIKTLKPLVQALS
jgi:hypothetical protein